MIPPITGDESARDDDPHRGRLVCRACGRVHRAVSLAPGDKAWCIRCGTALAKGSRVGLDGALACAVTGMILAVPAALLPFVTVSNLANERVAVLFSGVVALWEDGMRLVALGVLVCGALAPVLMLGTVAAIALPVRLGRRPPSSRVLSTLARALEHWAMPEVQVLAVLVAVVKLHTLVDIRVESGFWCYVAVSLMALLAWRSFDLTAVATLDREDRPSR